MLKKCAPSSAVAFSGEVVFAELTGNVVRLQRPQAGPSRLGLWPGIPFAPRLPPNMFSESGRGLFLAASLAEELSVVGRPDGGSHARAVIPSHTDV